MKQNTTVLVVDDNADGRKILQSLLGNYGYHVLLATNGHEALAQAREHIPDMILLDIMMPDIDGYEVCRRLRADPQLAEVPVVMITALHDRQAKLQGIKAGADDFLVKPFDPVELTARVHSIARLNRYRRLMSERAKLNWVVEQAEEGYLEIEPDGRIHYANNQARRYLQLPDETELPDETFLALAGRQYKFQPPEAWTDWPDQNRTDSPRYLVRPDSEQAEALWLQSEHVESHSPNGGSYFIRLRDVTAEVQAQRSQWTFHAQVSHKLKTPLGLLTGFLELLEYELDMNVLPQMQQDMLKKVFSNSKRLRNDIVGIFRFMESPEIVRPGRSYCTLDEVSRLIDKISDALEITNIQLDHAGFEAADRELSISARAIELILWELLENSKRFHPQQTPAVQIYLDWLENDEQTGVQIQISDNGIHLPPEQLAKIWLPYYQAEKYFTGQMAGMGLGLAMVATLLWEIDGRYSMSNRADSPGIVVELFIPHKERPENDFLFYEGEP